MLELNKTDFINALKTAFVTASKQDVRYYLQSVLFEFTTDGLILVSTDGHRITKCKLSDESMDFQLVGNEYPIDRDAVETVLKAVKLARKGTDAEQMETVTLIVESEKLLKLNVAGMNFELPVLDAKYPDYRRIIANRVNEGVSEIGFNFNYLADIKTSFNHLRKSKEGFCKIEFNGGLGTAKITPGEFYSVKQLSLVEMYLMPARV